VQLLAKFSAVTRRVNSAMSPFLTYSRRVFERNRTEECEVGGTGVSSEIHVSSDCSSDAEDSDRFRPAGIA